MNAPAPVRLPAEWEAQEAVHIAWPANAPDWPGKFAPIQWVITEIIRHILPVTRDAPRLEIALKCRIDETVHVISVTRDLILRQRPQRD